MQYAFRTPIPIIPEYSNRPLSFFFSEFGRLLYIYFLQFMLKWVFNIIVGLSKPEEFYDVIILILYHCLNVLYYALCYKIENKEEALCNVNKHGF